MVLAEVRKTIFCKCSCYGFTGMSFSRNAGTISRLATLEMLGTLEIIGYQYFACFMLLFPPGRAILLLCPNIQRGADVYSERGLRHYFLPTRVEVFIEKRRDVTLKGHK